MKLRSEMGRTIMMRALLVKGLHRVLQEKHKLPAEDDEKHELHLRAHNAIQLCLVDEVSREVVDKDSIATLLLKLSLLQTKIICN